jgi:hydrogenase maturation factor HypF (carbamoyltransferase family)
MQIDHGNHDDNNNKIKLNKKLRGCPSCRKSRYVVLSSTIKDKRYHYRELYCHLCNISFSYVHAVTPFKLKEYFNNMKM